MTDAPAGVVLVHLQAFRISAVAPDALRTWVRRDAALDGVSLEKVETDMRRPAADVVDEILTRRPRLVGFCCYVWNHLANRVVARELKRRAPSVQVVFGGPEVSGSPKRELERVPEADFICAGEGEETFRLLLRSLFLGEGEPASVPGLALRRGAELVQTPEAPLIDLGQTVSPYLTGLMDGRGTEYCVLETSRGCPFTCTFCEWGSRTVRNIPEDRLAKEFALLAGMTGHIHTTDADLAMNKTRAVRLLELFLRSTEGSPIMLDWELNPVFLAPEIVDVLARAQAKFTLSFGIQTVRESVLRNVERTFDREKVEANLRYFRRKAPSCAFMFSTIFGLPGDDLEGLRETVDWCLRWHPSYMRVNQPQVLPGTALERDARPLGLAFQEDPPHLAVRTAHMSEPEMGAARELACYFAVLMNLPRQYHMLLAAAQAHEAEPLAFVRVLEDWIASLKAKGVALPGAEGWRATDDRLTSQAGDDCYLALRADPLLTAAMMRVTEHVSELWRQGAPA